MKKVAIIVIYFGEWPEFWPLFIESLRRNPLFDFLIFGNKVPEFELAANVLVTHTSLSDMKARFSDSLSIEIALEAPYKFCDVRPMFGEIFDRELADYDFWGFCDNDLVFGDLSQFITTDVMAIHDRIFTRGCLSLYRNTPEINSLFRQKIEGADWQIVLSTSVPMAFDEWSGIHRIAEAQGIKTYLEEVILDIDPRHYDLRRTREYLGGPQTMCWKNGKIFLHQFGRPPQEFALIHLQKRKLKYKVINIGSCSVPEPIVYFSPEQIIMRDHVVSCAVEMQILNPKPLMKALTYRIGYLRRRARNALRKFTRRLL